MARRVVRPFGAPKRQKNVTRERRVASLRRVAGLLLVLCIASARVAAVPQTEPAAQQSAGPLPASPSQGGAVPASADLLSIQRVRRQLEQQPPLEQGFRINRPRRDGKLPVYRVRVEGYQFRLPALRDSLVVNSAPTPLGGWDFERMRSKAVSPVAWGSETPFAYSDPVGAGPTPFERLQGLVAKAVKAHADDNNARARAEVQQELAEVAAHNARVATGLSGDEGDAKKTNEKGKQVDKKKRTGRR